MSEEIIKIKKDKTPKKLKIAVINCNIEFKNKTIFILFIIINLFMKIIISSDDFNNDFDLNFSFIDDMIFSDFVLNNSELEKKFIEENFVIHLNDSGPDTIIEQQKIHITITSSIYSKIRLNISGIGKKNILGSSFFENFSPNLVTINGINASSKSLYGIYNFSEANNYVEIEWKNSITNCSFMFHQCKDITFIDLSDFNSYQVEDMHAMFSGCESLISLNLSNLNTSKVNTMWDMFYGCSSLISLDVSNFDTSQVTDMTSMFYNCISLTYLNISNFNTSNVNYMRYMFYQCNALTVLDVSNFDTSNVKSMEHMFFNCTFLTSLNLSNFDTSNVSFFQWMFCSSYNLEYINIEKFSFEKLNYSDYSNTMFDYVPDNIVICFKNDIKILLNYLKNKKCFINDCSNDWKKNQKKLINNNNTTNLINNISFLIYVNVI